MRCKYKDTLCKYAIEYNKLGVLKWALENNFNYSYNDCITAIDKNNPDALGLILKENNYKKLLEKELSITKYKINKKLETYINSTQLDENKKQALIRIILNIHDIPYNYNNNNNNNNNNN